MENKLEFDSEIYCEETITNENAAPLSFGDKTPEEMITAINEKISKLNSDVEKKEIYTFTKEEIYTFAKYTMKDAKTYKEFYTIARIFHNISGYKDADQLKAECVSKGNKMKDEYITLCMERSLRCFKGQVSQQIERQRIGKKLEAKRDKLTHIDKTLRPKMIGLGVLAFAVYIVVSIVLIFSGVQNPDIYEKLGIPLMLIILSIFIYYKIRAWKNKKDWKKLFEEADLDEIAISKAIDEEERYKKEMAHWHKILEETRADVPPFEI